MQQQPHCLFPLAVANTFIEWVEYSFYLYFAPIISQRFFPSTDQNVALLMSYGLFALAYFTRPLGALLFGHLSDSYGRKIPMILAMILMGGATVGIGVLPDYAQIGLIAPCLLLLLRMLQSLAVSGEFQSAAIYLMEHASANQRPFAGSLVIAAAAGGMFVGGLIASHLSANEVMTQYWRWPFVVTGVITLLLSLLRARLLETPLFLAQQAAGRRKLRPLQQLRQYKSTLLRLFLVSAFVCVYVYLANAYYTTYLVQQAGFSLSDAHLYCSVAQLFVVVLTPLLAYHLRPETNIHALRLGIIGFIFLAPWQFYVAQQGWLQGIVIALALFAICNACVSASIAYFLYMNLPTAVRCTGVGLAWNLAAASVGGLSPLIAASLVNQGYLLAPAWIIVFFAGLAWIVLQLAKKEPRQQLA